ncbi:MAG: hypothetical protein OEO19_10105 [Gammaproteobacteria bacterium]|nr:hypothetical protein [Gammaproteobacteria bacterium]MDH3450597.1 hypothetical protein [Gammaproteobacteria bacterium]
MKKIKTEGFIRLQLTCRVVTLGLLAALLWGPGSAQAEPYLAIQEGYKCSKCHVNMTGGGKRTDFANVYVQTRLSSNFLNWRDYLPALGDDEDAEENPLKTDATSSFFSGRLNDYIAIGGDFRSFYEAVDTPGEGRDDSFNQRKQNIYLEVDLIPERVIFYQTLEGGGDAREIVGILKGDLAEEPYYLKVGQFFLPYGLRLQDDSAFTRAVTGFTYGTTDVGLEFGYEPGPWSLQIAGTNGTGSSIETNLSKRITASAAYVQKTYRFGASYSSNTDASKTETLIYGLYAGAQFGRVGLLFEADIVDDETVEQYVSILEFNFLISRGKNLKLSYEYHDPDRDIFENANERYSLVYEPFLNQFVQVRAGARDNKGIPQNPSLNSSSYFLELHLYF